MPELNPAHVVTDPMTVAQKVGRTRGEVMAGVMGAKAKEGTEPILAFFRRRTLAQLSVQLQRTKARKSARHRQRSALDALEVAFSSSVGDAAFPVDRTMANCVEELVGNVQHRLLDETRCISHDDAHWLLNV